jgi:prepilin-type N-terminal cleavage/methylation domain-containing protein
MKTIRSQRGFTLIEMLVSVGVLTSCMALCLSAYVMMSRTMYKDNQRLATNASLRSFMAQISKETLDASCFYLFKDYSKLDGSVDLVNDPATLNQNEDYSDSDYDKWVAHGDCLVLVTKTSQYRTTDIRQIRVYYRRQKTQADCNNDAPLRYYETADWGEGSADDGNVNTDDTNGHPFSSLATYLNAINLNTGTTGVSYTETQAGKKYNAAAADFSGSKLLNLRTRGRSVKAPYTPYAAGDRFPIFSAECASASASSGFISINVEFINGTTSNNLLSSSSFNYTISPRR